MKSIHIALPRSRLMPGPLELRDDDGVVLCGPYWVLGRADRAEAARKGNPTCDPMLHFGHTPDGLYEGRVVAALNPPDLHSYGPGKRIWLIPEFLLDRSDLMIHGGLAGPHGALRPTYGCIRMRDPDIAELVQTLGLDTRVAVIIASTDS